MVSKFKVYFYLIFGFVLLNSTINTTQAKVIFSKNQTIEISKNQCNQQCINYTVNFEFEDDSIFEINDSEDDTRYEFSRYTDQYSLIKPKNNPQNSLKTRRTFNKIKIFLFICSLKLLF